MEGKKISFGFKKIKKIEKPIVQERKEYIECVEEKSIKVVGGETVQDNTPLIIPMKPNTLITAERLKEIAEKVESTVNEPVTEEPAIVKEEKPPENETLDQMAIRELMQEAKKEVKVETQALTVPVPAKPVTDGEKESTLDDYEAVPVQQFGMAMLRGMGWTPNKDQSKYKPPQLRPKGLGLGADKVISENQKKKSNKDNKDEELVIVKNSFVRIITTGKYSGCYGKVVSLDEDNGRVMVDIPVKKETVSLSEFMMYAVTKSEYDKEAKVINADTFDEYKKKEKGQSSSNHKNDLSNRNREERNEVRDYRRQKDTEKPSNGRSREKERQRRDSSSTEKSTRKKKDKKKYSSSESLSSLSDSDRKRKKKHRKRSSSSESSDYKKSKKRSSEGKRDIDKKRKGKKKKRDRDRSPNYKKYRK